MKLCCSLKRTDVNRCVTLWFRVLGAFICSGFMSLCSYFLFPSGFFLLLNLFAVFVNITIINLRTHLLLTRQTLLCIYCKEHIDSVTTSKLTWTWWGYLCLIHDVWLSYSCRHVGCYTLCILLSTCTHLLITKITTVSHCAWFCTN